MKSQWLERVWNFLSAVLIAVGIIALAVFFFWLDRLRFVWVMN